VEPSSVAIRWTFNGRSLTDATHGRAGRSRDATAAAAADSNSERQVLIRRRGGGAGGGLSTHVNRNQHSLHIAAFDVTTHEGAYQCVATTSAGSLISAPATLEPAGSGIEL